jgi:D-alanine-D-alanine ligase
MNKIFSKIIFENFGIQCPKGILANKISTKEDFNFPIIVKPICGGSSNGLVKLDSKNKLKEFIKKNKLIIDQFLFEEFIPGRELTVGILDNKICGIMEIVFQSELYDFKNKYISIPEHIINPNLPKKIKSELRNQSLMIHKKLNCNCLSRLDFRYNEKENELYLLEINTQPGLTKNSLLPEMAKDRGISFLKLCEIILANPICEKF